MSFRDHFSGHAECYASARPTYPDALFEWLASRSPSRALAWDAGTGNGQAARGLARWFERVHATDASAAQIAEAEPHERVTFAVEPAERCSLPSDAADLVVVAQALHWFDRAAFFAEVERVLRPGGLFAAVTYANARIDDAVDAVVRHLYEDVLGPHWPAERRLVETGYAEIAFPLAGVPDVPSFEMHAELDLGGLVAYLESWSATRRHREATGEDALDSIRPALAAAWGPPERVRRVGWPLTVRCRIKEPR